MAVGTRPSIGFLGKPRYKKLLPSGVSTREGHKFRPWKAGV
jgi:hypothetical protein